MQNKNNFILLTVFAASVKDEILLSDEEKHLLQNSTCDLQPFLLNPPIQHFQVRQKIQGVPKVNMVPKNKIKKNFYNANFY